MRGPSAAASAVTSTASGPAGPAGGRPSASGSGGVSDGAETSGNPGAGSSIGAVSSGTEAAAVTSVTAVTTSAVSGPMGPMAGSSMAVGFGTTPEGRKSGTRSGKAVESRGPSAAVSVETSTASGPAGPAAGRLSMSGPGGASDDTKPSGCFKCGKRGHNCVNCPEKEMRDTKRKRSGPSGRTPESKHAKPEGKQVKTRASGLAKANKYLRRQTLKILLDLRRKLTAFKGNVLNYCMTVKRIKFKLIRIKAWTLGSCLIERLNSLQACRTSLSCGRVRQVEVVDLVGVYDGKSGSPKTIRLAITNRLSGSPEGSVVADDVLAAVAEKVVGCVGVDDDQSGLPECSEAVEVYDQVVGAEEVVGLSEVDDELFGFPENSILDLGRQLFGFSRISILDLGGNYCIQRKV